MPLALAQSVDEQVVGPGTDASFGIGRDIGPDHDSEWRFDRPAAGEGLARAGHAVTARAGANVARYRPRSIWRSFCGSRLVPTLSCARPDATRLDATIASTIAAATLRHARLTHGRAVRGSRVLGPDRLGRTLSRTSDEFRWLGESAEQRYWVAVSES
jgi:hypothetical protein